jgi:tetratricopeptide (TPR) repeat protein
MNLHTRREIIHSDPETRRSQAVRAVDSLLFRKVRNLPGALRPNHPARLEHWQHPLRDDGGVLVRYSPEEFARLDALEQHVEVCRAEAEALLVHEQLGHLLLKDSEREELQNRALGLLPPDENSRFQEIVTLHALSPKHIMVDSRHFAAGIRGIEKVYGLGTALGYGLLLVAGIRTNQEMLRYGRLFQQLFDRLTTAPSVVRTLSRLGDVGSVKASFDLLFATLTQLREQLLAALPRQEGIEFRFTRVLEAVQAGVEEISVGLLGALALDSAVLARLGFRSRLVLVDSTMYLEIPLSNRSVYWEPANSTPLSCVPLQVGRKADIFDLFALSFHHIGLSNARQGQMTRAIKAYRQALELEPEMAETYNELGQVYLRCNQPNDAMEACQAAVKINPQFAEAYITLASAHLARFAPDEAIEALRVSIRLKPNIAEAFNNLGFAFEQKGEHEKAIVAFSTAVRIRADYAHAQYNLGNALLNAGRVDDAIDAYLQTLRVNPEYIRAFYNLGQAYYQRHMLQEAIDAYQRVLGINPKHAGALYNLGIVYRDLGEKERAVEMLERAVELNPNLLR